MLRFTYILHCTNAHIFILAMTTLEIDCKAFINVNRMCLGFVLADYICYAAARERKIPIADIDTWCWGGVSMRTRIARRHSIH